MNPAVFALFQPHESRLYPVAPGTPAEWGIISTQYEMKWLGWCYVYLKLAQLMAVGDVDGYL